MAEIGREATLPLYERSGLASAAIFGDLTGIADRRTLEILERRRTSNPHRRGWLVRRLLVLADVVGLVLAFVAVELVFGAGAGAGNRATSVEESLLLLATLPGWIVVAKLYGLYDQDEERTHHPTIDDFRRLPPRHGRRLALLRRHLGVRHRAPGPLEADRVLGRCDRPRDARASLRSKDQPAQPLVPPEHDHRRRRRRRPAHRAQAAAAPGVRDQPRRLRRRASPATARRARPASRARPVRAPAGARRGCSTSSASSSRSRNDSAEETLALVRSLEELDVQIDIVPRLFELVGPTRRRRTRSRACRSSGCRRVRLSPSSRLIKRAIDIVGRGDPARC